MLDHQSTEPYFTGYSLNNIDIALSKSG